MADDNPVQHCDVCKVGIVTRVLQQIVFRQWTDKGYVVCRPIVRIDVCNHCGMKTWDHGEQIIEQAVRDEYNKLP
jgi:hypothetical protein